MGADLDHWLWQFFSNKLLTIYASESASACIWMIVIALLRSIVLIFGYDASYFPLVEVVAACPLFAQSIMVAFPFMTDYPLLPVRIAETVMGRLSPLALIAAIPAQIIGNIMGLVIFKTLCPFAPNAAFGPVSYSDDSNAWWSCIPCLMRVVGSVFMYVCVLLVVPDMLQVNKYSSRLLSIPTIPFILLNFKRCMTFNPTTIYAFWYVNYCDESWSPMLLLRSYVVDNAATQLTKHSNNNLAGSLQLEYISAAVLAAVAAGLFVGHVFPEDGSWIRKRSVYTG